MAQQYSTAVRNAKLDAIETTIGASAIMKIFDGTKPLDCSVADAGTVLATLNLPADYMAAASGGTKAKSGTWDDQSADATGTAQYYRIYASDGTTCHAQGSVGTSGADMIVDSTAFTAGQAFTVTGYSIADNNA